MTEQKTSRRSFVVDLMTRAAGAWLLVSGVAACDPMATKYGGISPEPDEDAGPVAKYGGPPEDAGEDAGPVAKYGGPPEDAGEDAGPSAKYGGPSADAGV